MGWSHDDLETLKHLWNKERMSAGEIAQVLEGKSRNAVLGQVRRLNLDPRVDPEIGTVAFRVGDVMALKISDVELNEARTVRQCGAEMHLPPDRAAAVWKRICDSLGWQAAEHGDEIVRKIDL